MNYKNLILIAVIASILAIACVSPVMALDPYYEEKIVPINIVQDLNNDIQMHTGQVTFIPRGQTLQDMHVYITNDAQPNITFDYVFRPDGSSIDGQNPNTKVVMILPAGRSDLIPLPAGNYTWYVQKGNSDQPESGQFTVVDHQYTYVTYLGDAVPTDATKTVIVPSSVHICIADYYGVWNSQSERKIKLGIGGSESVVTAMQNYINTHPAQKSFVVSADVGDIIMNGDRVHVGDPATGWVKDLTVAYTYKDSHGHTKIGAFTVVEDDTGSYPGSNPLHLPMSATISS